MSLFNGELTRLVVDLLGDSIREPALMHLGNPINGEVDIDLANAEHPGLVWVHPHRGNNQIISNNPELADDDKVSGVRALIMPNLIPDDMRIYGTPVYTVSRKGILNVIDLGGMAAVEYLYGLKNHPQRSIDISQFDYGLIRPTAPPGRTIITSPFRPTLDGQAYDVPALQSTDLITDYGFLADGKARAIKIEIDPKTNLIYLEAGAVFTDTTHQLGFSNYPRGVTAGRYLMGWVKMYKDISRITVNDIYSAQEIYSKDTISGFAVLGSIVTQFGEVVTAEGKVVIYYDV
jgi:hypothetical protein